MNAMYCSCVVIAVASLAVVTHVYKTIMRQRRSARRSGLQLQHEVMRWMVLLQQHRGMASGLLQGDLSFRSRLYDKQAELEAQLAKIRQLPAEIADLMPVTQWAEILTRWQSLRQGVEQLTPATSFSAHTDLIAQLLLLLGEIGDRAGLTLDQQDSHFALLRLVTRVLPQLMETAGQTRALSTAVAVKGVLDSVPQIRLSFLLNKLERLSDEARASLQRMPANLSADASVICNERDQALQAVADFRDCIEHRVLGHRGVTVKAEEVFRQATSTIDACYRLYETVLPPLQREVGQAVSRNAPAVPQSSWQMRPA